jgi:hypothetical protein
LAALRILAALQAMPARAVMGSRILAQVRVGRKGNHQLRWFSSAGPAVWPSSRAMLPRDVAPQLVAGRAKLCSWHSRVRTPSGGQVQAKMRDPECEHHNTQDDQGQFARLEARGNDSAQCPHHEQRRQQEHSPNLVTDCCEHLRVRAKLIIGSCREKR